MVSASSPKLNLNLSPPRSSIFSWRPVNLLLSGLSFYLPTNEASAANNVVPARHVETNRLRVRINIDLSFCLGLVWGYRGIVVERHAFAVNALWGAECSVRHAELLARRIARRTRDKWSEFFSTRRQADALVTCVFPFAAMMGRRFAFWVDGESVVLERMLPVARG
jgi:hypothetical protein